MNSSQFSYDALVLAKSIRDDEYKGEIFRSQAMQKMIERKLVTFTNGMWRIMPRHIVQKYRWINGKMLVSDWNKPDEPQYTYYGAFRVLAKQ